MYLLTDFQNFTMWKDSLLYRHMSEKRGVSKNTVIVNHPVHTFFKTRSDWWDGSGRIYVLPNKLPAQHESHTLRSKNVPSGTKSHLFPRHPGKDAAQGPPKLPEGRRLGVGFGGSRVASSSVEGKGGILTLLTGQAGFLWTLCIKNQFSCLPGGILSFTLCHED